MRHEMMSQILGKTISSLSEAVSSVVQNKPQSSETSANFKHFVAAVSLRKSKSVMSVKTCYSISSSLKVVVVVEMLWCVESNYPGKFEENPFFTF